MDPGYVLCIGLAMSILLKILPFANGIFHKFSKSLHSAATV